MKRATYADHPIRTELGRTIEKYFESDLFRNLSGRRQHIRDYAHGRHSWNVVGDLTRDAYVKLLRSDSK